MLSGYYENAFIGMLSYPYLSSSFRQALAELYYGVEYGRGLLLVVGNRGSGKTTLLRHFQGRLQAHFRTLLLACADREMSQIWSDVVDKLGIEPPHHDLASMLARIDELQSQQAQPLVLMLDDIQGKDRVLLETINRFSALVAFRKGRLSIVLTGSAELVDQAASIDHLRGFQYVKLAPLAPTEVEGYIDHRLRMMEGGREPLFTKDAYPFIAHQSQGLVARINDICSKALCNSTAQTTKPIDAAMLKAIDSGAPVLSQVAPTSSMRALHFISRKRTAVGLSLIVCGLSIGLWYGKPTIWLRRHSAISLSASSFEHSVPSGAEVSSLNRPSDGVSLAATPSVKMSAAKPQPSPGIALHGPSMSSSPTRPRATPNIAPSPAPIAARTEPKFTNLPGRNAGAKMLSGNASNSLTAAPRSDAEALRAAALQKQILLDISLGDSYLERGQYDQAVKSFHNALVLSPGNPAIPPRIERALRAKAAEANILK
jgi:general secretion pathway protein A